MDLCTYFEPISKSVVDSDWNKMNRSFGTSIATYWEDASFPDLKNVTIALVGVKEDRGAVHNKGCAAAPDCIRRKLYTLSCPSEDMKAVDLGNICAGKSKEDTYFALTEVLYKLLDRNITVIILGGSQDLTFAQYKAYEILGRVINIVAIDPRFDLNDEEETTSSSYLNHIVQQQPNYLFNFTNIGYQTYFSDKQIINLMDNLEFDVYRVGRIQSDMEGAEPLLRAADMVTIDISAVRQSDAPAHADPSPHGFYGEELCRLARFAGMNDKLSSIGFYEINPQYDNRLQTSHMTAQAIWHFVEGFYNRKSDFPRRDNENYKHYLVSLSQQSDVPDPCMEINFYKSKKSDRWWMEVPCEMSENRERYKRHLLIPCSYTEYKQAMNNDLPDLWWRFYKRINH